MHLKEGVREGLMKWITFLNENKDPFVKPRIIVVIDEDREYPGNITLAAQDPEYQVSYFTLFCILLNISIIIDFNTKRFCHKIQTKPS